MNANTQTIETAAATNWSPYQQAIFTAIETTDDNLIIEAVAGAGKTTTIVEGVKRACGNVVFLAFNRSIATELASRGVPAKTFHGLCFSPALRSTGGKLNADKMRDILFAAVNSGALSARDANVYGGFAKRLVGLARNSGVGALVPDSESVWTDLVTHHDLDLDDESGNIARGIEIARALLAEANSWDDMDFDDLLYRVVRDGIRLPQFDVVFVDEAQDTNAIQRAVLRKVSHAGTRIIAVGDPAQAIYGFRGADSSAMDGIATEFNCKRMPLTVSYRCPQAVVEHARQWMTHIEAHESAPVGVVRELVNWKPADFNPGDMVVCRAAAPLLATAYAMIRAHKSVMVMGREIGAGLKALVERMQAKGIDRLIEKLEDYLRREIERAVAQQNEQKAAAVADRVESIQCLIAGLPENTRTIPELFRVIDTLFANKDNAVILATIHKSKGLEAKRVFWLDSSRCPSPWARRDWQRKQEENLCYVATTRAKEELILIESEARGF